VFFLSKYKVKDSVKMGFSKTLTRSHPIKPMLRLLALPWLFAILSGCITWLLYSSFFTILLFLSFNYKKCPLIMQVDNSTQPQTTMPPHFAIREDAHSSPFFLALLPLVGYHERLSITTRALPAELIDMIQAFCSHDDLLALTAVDKTALATRFCNPPLQKLCFKTEKDTEQFLAYCQTSQEKEAQELILEEGQKSHKRLKSALLPGTTTRFISFTREHLQAVNALTLTLSDQFTAEQYNLLFTCLPETQHLTIYIHSTLQASHALSVLFKAAQRLTLHHIAIFAFNGTGNYLPNELWQFTTLKTLRIQGFKNVVSIPKEMGQLRALKSLELSAFKELKALPASLGQLDKLEALTLRGLNSVTALPGKMGQLKSLTSLKLQFMYSLKALPASLWQLGKLEALTLKNLRSLTALPEDIGQLKSLTSLTLQCMYSLQALPASIGQLNKLEAFTLGAPRISILPKEIGQLRALKSLELSYLWKLKALPASLEKLDKLEALTLEGWDNITALPGEISQLTALKSLTLQNMPLLKALPASIKQLNKLEALTLSSLPSLTTLPEEMGQLRALKVVKLINIGDLGKLPGELAQIVERYELPAS
jgi:Leucine-rich repeat (LRR) protein